MKKKVQLLMAILLSVSLFPVMTVGAVEEPAAETPTTTEQQQEPTESTKPVVEDDPKSADYAAKLKERLEKRKETIKTKLTKAQETRVKARCKAAQGLIQSVSTKAKGANTSRSEVYTKIVSKLTTLEASLKKQGVDTTELEKQVVELQALISTFETDMSNLRQAAADISNMDCTTDPSGFKASLEALRTARETVAKDSTAIRAYVTDTIKPTLQALRATVKDTKTKTEGSN